MPTSTTRILVSKSLASFTPLLLTLCAFAVQPVRAPAQTTAFTYQGQLTEAGTGANGNYDMQFALFDIAVGGVQIGPAQAVPTVPVSNGLFTVQLDFGVNAFPGANRFVEIGVRPTGGSGFQTLAPRQQISSTPYAIRTLSAATADMLSSTCTGCVQDAQIQSVAGSKVSGTIPVGSVPAGSGNYIQNRPTEQANANFNISGNGRIGGDLTVAGTLNANVGGNFIQNRTTPQPNANFNISGDGTAGTLSANVINATRIGIGTGLAVFKLHVVDPGSSGLRVQTNTPGGTQASFGGFGDFQIDANNVVAGRLKVKEDGRVGIGTAAPQTKLDVHGDVRLGTNGQYFAPGGEENLRIVRGELDVNGNITGGPGFG